MKRANATHSLNGHGQNAMYLSSDPNLEIWKNFFINNGSNKALQKILERSDFLTDSATDYQNDKNKQHNSNNFSTSINNIESTNNSLLLNDFLKSEISMKYVIILRLGSKLLEVLEKPDLSRHVATDILNLSEYLDLMQLNQKMQTFTFAFA